MLEKGQPSGTIWDCKQESSASEQSFFRELYQNTPAMLHSIDHDGVLLCVSNKWLEVMGYSREEVIGRKSIDFLTEESRRRAIHETLPAFFKDGFCSNVPYKFIKKNGQTIDILLSANSEKDSRGKFIRSLCFLQDVTHTKQLGKELKAKQYYLEKAQELGKIGTWELDLKTDRLVWTDQCCVIFGVPKGSVVDLTFFLERVHPQDRAYVENAWAMALSGEPYKVEHRLLVDGQVKWVRQEAEIHLDTALAIGFTQDITGRVAIENSLEMSEQRFQRAVENAKDPTAYHAEGEVLYLSRSWCEQTGYAAVDIQNLPRWFRHVDPTSIEAHSTIKGWDSKIESGERVIQTKKRGKRIWRFSSIDLGLLADGRRSYLTLAKDVSDEQKWKMQLQQSQKMEAIGTLAGGIAHDFNNILSVIMGYGEVILQQLPEHRALRDEMRIILDSTDRAKELVSQILTFARRNDEVKYMPVKVQQILTETIKFIRATIPSNITLEKNIETTCPKVFADSTQIHQVIMNLLTNARHAIGEQNGVISVTLRDVAVNAFNQSSMEVGLGRYVCLSVKDSGSGMKKETLNRIFEPYFTTKGKDEGTGLGLAVCHGIISELGGTITVRSEPWKGSEFHVYIPVAKSEMSKSMGPAEVDSVTPCGAQEHILVVDDEPARSRRVGDRRAETRACRCFESLFGKQRFRHRAVVVIVKQQFVVYDAVWQCQERAANEGLHVLRPLPLLIAKECADVLDL